MRQRKFHPPFVVKIEAGYEIDRYPRPGDERLSLLMTRRSTLDWVLRRTIATENCIQHLCGLRATGLIADGQQVHHRCEIRAMRKMKETTQQLQSG